MPLNTKIEDCLDRVIAESFESLAFLEAVRNTQTPENFGNEGWHWTSLIMPDYGQLQLGMEESVLIDIATTLFGGEPPNREAWLDTLNEVINIVAGRLVAALGGESREIHLSLPEKLSAPPDKDGGVIGAYELDGGGALVLCFHPLG